MKILFTPLTGSSVTHVIRCFAIAEVLKKRGHKIYFTSGRSAKGMIERQGYPVVKSYDDINLNDPKDQSINYLKAHKDKFLNWFRAEIEATEEIQPNIVVTASGLLGPHTYHATKIPVVAIINTQYLPESKGLMGVCLAKDILTHKILRLVLRPIFERKFIQLYLSEVLDIYKKLGLSTDIKSRAELYKPMSVLIPGDESFEPLRKERKDTHFIGPLFWQGFERMKTDLTDEKLRKFKGNNKMIYLCFGTSIFERNIYKRVLELFLKTHYKKVVALGGNFKREEFPHDNRDMIIRNFVPGLKVCKYADVIVNSGAQGTMMQGLIFGKPQVTFPITIDQAYFANRLEEMHMGINANKVSILGFSRRENFNIMQADTPQNIIASIEEILNKSYYTKKAKAIAKKLKSYKDPAGNAADLVESYAQ
ncbi:hypothetical protein JW766_06350 [Candidatus Dojkabacteria bacterium]|nr:hypothetical protein [Candidatus Dojkabacteria bacterium]